MSRCAAPLTLCLCLSGLQRKIKKFAGGIGPPGGRKWPAVLWKISQLDLAGWKDMLAKNHVRVINMLMTKAPEVVGDAALPPAPAPGAAPCLDSNTQQCPLWAANGDCRGNSQWMQSNCCKSCSATASTTTAPTSAAPPPAPVTPVAGPGAQVTPPVPAPMAAPVAAPVSAPTTLHGDTDMATQCPLWAQRGDCTSNAAYMCFSCTLSCAGLCSSQSVSALQGTSSTGPICVQPWVIPSVVVVVVLLKKLKMI